MKKLINNKIFFILFSTIILTLLYLKVSIDYATFAHDDPTNMWIFSELRKEKGFFGSFYEIFTNFDFRNSEYRTFWLSRLLHYLLFNLFSYQPTIYLLIIHSLHLITSYFLYRLIAFFFRNKEISFYILLLWIFTPFSAPLYIFHHFCYQVLPVYIFIFYLFLIFVKQNKNLLTLFICLFSLIFSGEHILPMLYFLFIFLLIFYFKRKKFQSLRIQVSLLILISMSLLIHFFYLKNLSNTTSVHQRFKLFSNISMDTLINNLIPWTKLQVIPTFYQIIFINTSQYKVATINNFRKIIFYLIIINSLCFILGKKNGVLLNKKIQISLKQLFILLFIILLSFSLYYYLIAMSGGGGYFERYTFLSGFLLLFLMIIIFFYIFKRKIARVFSIIFINYFIFIFLFSNLEIKQEVFSLNTKIKNEFKKNTDINKKNLIVANLLRYPPKSTDTVWWNIPYYSQKGNLTGLIPLYLTGIQNPYKYYYSLDRIAQQEYGYNFISYSDFKEEDDDIVLKNFYGQEKKVKKNTIFIIGMSNINYSYSDLSKYHYQSFVNFTDFKKSLFYKGVYIFSPLNNYYLKLSNLPLDPFKTIDLGNTFSIDYLQDSNYSIKTNYGFIEGNDSINKIAQDNYPNSYWYSNRAGEFSYQLPNETKGNFYLVFDFLDLWSIKKGQRIFSIEVNRDGYIEKIGPIDPILIAGINQPFAIAIWIGDCEILQIKTIKENQSIDIPFISGIRLYHELNL